MIGEAISHYRILSKLGEGGMGEVYLAEDARLRRRVALKILPGDLASNKDRMRRFIQEAQAAAALNHPNIAHIYGVEESGGVRALVMELVGRRVGCCDVVVRFSEPVRVRERTDDRESPQSSGEAKRSSSSAAISGAGVSNPDRPGAPFFAQRATSDFRLYSLMFPAATRLAEAFQSRRGQCHLSRRCAGFRRRPTSPQNESAPS